jgi:hypothetical protein
MRKSSVISLLLGLFIFVSPLWVKADHHEVEVEVEDEAPALSDVWIIVPKSGMETKFAEAVMAEKVFRAEAKDSRSWQVYNVVLGDDYGAVGFRACCFDWADEDAYVAEIAAKGLDAHWNASVHQYVDHYNRHFESTDMQNSYWPAGEGNGPYYGVTTWTRKEGASPASEEARVKMSQIGLTEGWASIENNWVWLLRETGKPQLLLVTSYESFADMAPPEESFFEFLTEMKGPEEATTILDAFYSGFSASDYTVWMRNAELSAAIDSD